MSDVKGIIELPTADIDVNGNVRTEAKASPALVASIQQHGIIQPIIVRYEDDGWLVVAGHRRFAAAQLLGLATIPVSVIVGKRLDEEDIIGLQVTENLQRENLTDWELAQAALDLKDIGLKQAEVAAQMGVSKKDVSSLQKAGKSEISDEVGNQFDLAGLLELADAAKQTELRAEDLASAVVNGEARNMYGAVRHVKHDVDEIAIMDELAVLQKEWDEAGITVTMNAPDLTGGNDHHGYPKRDKNILRVQEHDGYAGILIPLVKHIKLECHTIQIIPARGLGNTSWTHWCTNAKSHRKAGSSELKATNTKTSGTAMSDTEKADRRAVREAKALRMRQAGMWLGLPPSAILQKEIATFHALKTWKEDTTRGVVLALIANGEIEPRPKGAPHGWYTMQLASYFEEKFGDNTSKMEAWKVKALDAYQFVEHIAHWPHREQAWDDISAIEVRDE